MQETIDKSIGEIRSHNVVPGQRRCLRESDTVEHINEARNCLGNPPLDDVEVALNRVGIVKREDVKRHRCLLLDEGENLQNILLGPSV